MALKGAGPSNFYTPYNSLKCISSRTWGAGRPHVGLCPIFLVFLFFNQTQDLRAHSADRRETLHSDQHMRQHLMQVQKLRGSSPKKIWQAKKMQNLDRFYTTSDFDREYLRNETRYQKSKRHVISSDSSRVQTNKSGELWSTIHKVVHVSSDPPKSTFSTHYISAPRGCWVLRFLHVLEFDQALVAHIAIGVGGPLKNFKGQHLKLGLKFHT